MLISNFTHDKNVHLLNCEYGSHKNIILSLIKMCVAIIEICHGVLYLLQFFFYLNSLPFMVSVITVLLISDLGAICLLENC